MKLRAAAVQGLGLGAAAVVLWWLAGNTAATLDRNGISFGFGFLRQPANFEIGDAAIPYSPADTFARAILVGLVNTARVSVLGWFLSIALGFVLGVLRLSGNPALRGIVRGTVEVMRNTPLLLLLLLLAATMHALPPVRAAFEPVRGVFVSDRGVAVPSVALEPLHLWLAALVALTVAARRRLGGRARWIIGVTAGALAVALVVSPPEWETPRLQGFNFAGGLTLSPELTALLAALVLHQAAHISEVVRGAILAVPKGQREASYALGLSRWQAMRLVIVPQALRAMVPLLATNCVSLAKNSSLAVAIGFPDVVSVLNTTANQTGHAIETMVLMMGVYLSLSLVVAAAMNGYNRRLLRVGH